MSHIDPSEIGRLQAASSKPVEYFRLNHIVAPHGILPIARSTWWQGVKDGRFPAAVHLGRIAMWRAADIEALIERINAGDA